MNQTACSHTGCENTHAESYWDNITAADKGWFVERNGTAYCPEHVPEWVPSWRVKQAEQKAK